MDSFFDDKSPLISLPLECVFIENIIKEVGITRKEKVDEENPCPRTACFPSFLECIVLALDPSLFLGSRELLSQDWDIMRKADILHKATTIPCTKESISKPNSAF